MLVSGWGERWRFFSWLTSQTQFWDVDSSSMLTDVSPEPSRGAGISVCTSLKYLPPLLGGELGNQSFSLSSPPEHHPASSPLLKVPWHLHGTCNSPPLRCRDGAALPSPSKLDLGSPCPQNPIRVPSAIHPNTALVSVEPPSAPSLVSTNPT